MQTVKMPETPRGHIRIAADPNGQVYARGLDATGSKWLADRMGMSEPRTASHVAQEAIRAGLVVSSNILLGVSDVQY